MACRVGQGKATHGQNMKQGSADRSKLSAEPANADPGYKNRQIIGQCRRGGGQRLGVLGLKFLEALLLYRYKKSVKKLKASMKLKKEFKQTKTVTFAFY